MNDIVMKATDLSIGYKSRNGIPKVVSDSLNLELLPGEMVCLLGPNGAGKSTLMRTLAGLQPAISGNIIVNDTPLYTLSPADLARNLSLVLTDRIEANNLTVRDVVGLGRIPYTDWLGKLTKLDHDKIEWALAATETAEFQNHKINSLSDGERQKVMLARALAQDTAIIFLDEPTAHLDFPSRVEMMRFLHHLARKENKTILLSTHELDLALQAADRLWLMKKNGSLITGSPEDLVLNGSFEATFSKSGFYFDKSSGSFTMYQEEASHEIFVEGIASHQFWIKRALRRNGYRAIDQDNTQAKISVSEKLGVICYTLDWEGVHSVHATIEELTGTLNQIQK